MTSTTSTLTEAMVSQPTTREIRVERDFRAPLERVWRAYTEHDQVRRWWGRGNDLEVVRFEPVRGGHWRFVEHTPDGDHGFEGRFAEVTPMERIVQTFEWDGMPGFPQRETAEFRAVDANTTKVVTTSIFFTEAERDGMLASGMESGLNESYRALDALLAEDAA